MSRSREKLVSGLDPGGGGRSPRDVPCPEPEIRGSSVLWLTPLPREGTAQMRGIVDTIDACDPLLVLVLPVPEGELIRSSVAHASGRVAIDSDVALDVLGKLVTLADRTVEDDCQGPGTKVPAVSTPCRDCVPPVSLRGLNAVVPVVAAHVAYGPEDFRSDPVRGGQEIVGVGVHSGGPPGDAAADGAPWAGPRERGGRSRRRQRQWCPER